MTEVTHTPALVPRPSARVLPVSQEGEVLLLLDQDPSRPGVVRWGTIGGAVDPGESLVDAAVREMYEETGITIDPAKLTPAFRRDQREFAYDGIHYAGDNTFFALPLEPADAVVSFEHLVPEEVGNVFEARWWTPADLAADGRLVAPDLCEILDQAIAAVAAQSRNLSEPPEGQL